MRTLQLVHLIASKAAEAPELMLDNDDAKLLGDATAEVLKHYKVKMTAKQEAYGLLIEAAAQVYPAMFVSLYIRKQAEAEAKKNAMRWPGGKKPDAPEPVKPASTTPPPASVAGVASPGFDPFKISIPMDK